MTDQAEIEKYAIIDFAYEEVEYSVLNSFDGTAGVEIVQLDRGDMRELLLKFVDHLNEAKKNQSQQGD